MLFSAAFFQSGLLALGSRAPCPAASPACGGRSKRGQFAGRKGLPFAGANYTAGISLCLPAFRWWNHGGRNFSYSLCGFSVLHECFCSGLCGLALRENIVLFLHRKAWVFPARPNERPLIPLLKKNKGGLSYSWRAS